MENFKNDLLSYSHTDIDILSNYYKLPKSISYMNKINAIANIHMKHKLKHRNQANMDSDSEDFGKYIFNEDIPDNIEKYIEPKKQETPILSTKHKLPYLNKVQDVLDKVLPEDIANSIMEKVSQQYNPDVVLFSLILRKLSSKHSNRENYEKIQALKQLAEKLGGKYKLFTDELINTSIQLGFEHIEGVYVTNEMSTLNHSSLKNGTREKTTRTEKDFPIYQQKYFYNHLDPYYDYDRFINRFLYKHNVNFDFVYKQIPKKAYDKYIELCLGDKYKWDKHLDDRLIGIDYDMEIVDEETGKIYDFSDIQDSLSQKKDLENLQKDEDSNSWDDW
jgi:hypothetical protein